MKKILTYLLLSAMLASTLASCSSGGGTSENDTTASGDETEQTTTAETAAEPTNADIISETYAGTDFDGYSFRILSISPGKHFYIKTAKLKMKCSMKPKPAISSTMPLLNATVKQKTY